MSVGDAAVWISAILQFSLASDASICPASVSACYPASAPLSDQQHPCMQAGRLHLHFPLARRVTRALTSTLATWMRFRPDAFNKIVVCWTRIERAEIASASTRGATGQRSTAPRPRCRAFGTVARPSIVSAEPSVADPQLTCCAVVISDVVEAAQSDSTK